MKCGVCLQHCTELWAKESWAKNRSWFLMLLINVHFVRHDLPKMIGMVSMDIRLPSIMSYLLYCFGSLVSTIHMCPTHCSITINFWCTIWFLAQ